MTSARRADGPGVVRLFGKGLFLTSLVMPLEKSVQTSESKNISSK